MKPFDFDDVPPPSAPTQARRPRPLAWLLVAVTLVVVLATTGLYFATRNSDSGASSPPTQPAASSTTIVIAHRTDTPVVRSQSSATTAEQPEPPEEKLPPRYSKGPRPMTERQKAILEKVQRVLKAPDRLTVYALHPYPPGREHPQAVFHDWKVLGQTQTHYAAERETVAATAESIGKGTGARCFEPRHGVRAEAGHETVDLVICFACSWVHVFLGADEDDRAAVFTISRVQSDALEKLLTDAGVRRPFLLNERDWLFDER